MIKENEDKSIIIEEEARVIYRDYYIAFFVTKDNLDANPYNSKGYVAYLGDDYVELATYAASVQEYKKNILYQ